jgi:hypothetical protein
MQDEADFFLGSSEHRNDWSRVRSCWIVAYSLMDDGRECALVDLAPPVIGQTYGQGDVDIVTVIIVPRWQNFRLGQSVDKPIPVLVYRPLKPLRRVPEVIRNSDIRLAAWCELYSSAEQAERAANH